MGKEAKRLIVNSLLTGSGLVLAVGPDTFISTDYGSYETDAEILAQQWFEDPTEPLQSEKRA